MTPLIHPIAITACSLLTPLDNPGSHVSTWDAIQQGQYIESTIAVHNALLDPSTELDRSLRLALAVGRSALAHQPPPRGTMLCCATSKGPVGTVLAAAEKCARGEAITESEARHIALGPSAMAACLSERLGIQDTHTSVAACASGSHALHRAAQALRRGECLRALVVAADASLHPLFEASFARLGILARPDANGIRRCEPFSGLPTGFFISEGAAAIVLDRAPLPNHPPLAWLEDTWIGGDGTSLLAVDPRAAALRAGLQNMLRDTPPTDLAFIHAHATGTAHDAHELRAIRSMVRPDIPVFSHKRFLGHSLGAAGLVSVALSLQCHRHARTLAGQPIPAERTRSLTIAQGFGGHVAIAKIRR